MKNNLKKLLAMVMALVMVFALAACGGDEEPMEEEEEDIVETEAEEELPEEELTEGESVNYIEVPVALVNGTGMDLVEIYCSGAGLEQWGLNILPEGKYLADGTYLDLVFAVDANNVAWDIACVSSEGQQFQLFDIDISQMPADGFVIELLSDGEVATGTALASMDDLQGSYSAGE